MARKITDGTFIAGVKYTYQKKGRAVTSNEVVDEMLRRRKERPNRFSKMIIKVEVADKLDDLAHKHKIRKIIQNRKEHYMPM